MRIHRVLMNEATFSDIQCDRCGYPMDLDEDLPHYYEIESYEHLAFCTKACAIDYMTDIESRLSDSKAA